MSGNHDLPRLAPPVDLLDQLRGGLSAGLGITWIDGDDLRVQKLHQHTSAVVCGVRTLATCS